MVLDKIATFRCMTYVRKYCLHLQTVLGSHYHHQDAVIEYAHTVDMQTSFINDAMIPLVKFEAKYK